MTETEFRIEHLKSDHWHCLFCEDSDVSAMPMPVLYKNEEQTNTVVCDECIRRPHRELKEDLRDRLEDMYQELKSVDSVARHLPAIPSYEALEGSRILLDQGMGDSVRNDDDAATNTGPRFDHRPTTSNVLGQAGDERLTSTYERLVIAVDALVRITKSGEGRRESYIEGHPVMEAHKALMEIKRLAYLK